MAVIDAILFGCDWEYKFGDNASTRLAIGYDPCAWAVGLCWSSQDWIIRILCFYIALDWFNDA